MWDVATGSEIAIFPFGGQKGDIGGVAFSPDGRAFAAASDYKGGVKIFRAATPEDVLEEKRRQNAPALVDRLTAELGSIGQVREHLRTKSTLDPELRQLAAAIATNRQDNPSALFDIAWQILKSPGSTRDDYVHAKQLAAAANELRPTDFEIIRAQGLAAYRLEQYRIATELLSKSAALRNEPDLISLNFLAMSQFQQGNRTEAFQMLPRLWVLMGEQALGEEPEWYFTELNSCCFGLDAEESRLAELRFLKETQYPLATTSESPRGTTPNTKDELSSIGKFCRASIVFDKLKNEFGLKLEMTTRLKPLNIAEPVRSLVLAMISEYQEEPSLLDKLSWETLTNDDENEADYRCAYEQAQAAYRLSTSNPSYLLTLGAAHYRIGHFAKAIENITQIESSTTNPSRYAFLAMACYKIGRVADYNKALKKMHEDFRRANFTTAEWRRLSSEAENIIKAK